MKIIAVPIQIGSVKIHVAKGRRWSVVEHALLEAVCREPQSAKSLADESCLPLRMVIEAMINLMRAGWVELKVEKQQGKFFATDGGKANVKLDDLPAVTRMVKKSVRFVVEQLEGSVLRYRDLDFVWGSRLSDSQYDEKLEVTKNLPQPNQVKIINSLLQDDEEYRGLASGAARPGDAYALAQVTGDRIRGLSGASENLLRQLQQIASKSTTKTAPAKVINPVFSAPTFDPVSLSFNPDQNLILGGEAHKKAFSGIISRAKARIIVHSTFIGGGACDEMVGLLSSAADRGVRVDILWGKSDTLHEVNSTKEACIEINRKMKAARIDQFVKAHAFSTGSHSKIVVADDGNDGWVTAIGSCNWLSTGFNAFEASVMIQDQNFAAGALNVIAQMSMAVTGLNGGIAADLAGQAVNVQRLSRANSGKRARAKLVLARQHSECILAARDEAKSSILLGSHRLGRSAPNLSIAPTKAAAAEKGINALLYYGRLSDGMTADAATDLRLSSGATGLKVRQIHDPRMHAKFLAWDDNDIVITSHNLLSADPSGDFDEVGVHVTSPMVGRYLREKLAWTFDNP